MVKLSFDYKMLANEIQNLKKIKKLKSLSADPEFGKHVSGMIDYGMIIFTNFNTVSDLEEKVAGYFIMPKYKINLEDYFIRKNKIDPGFLFEVVLQLIDALKIVHISGRTYNDMKPENIMVQKDKSDEKYVVLIDFGFAEKFINEK